MITFKENVGVEGRGSYFDDYGIIRDVMQNHLLQMMSLVSMEPPVTLGAEDVRNEKVKVMRAIPTLTLSHMIVGQYGTDEKKQVIPYAEDVAGGVPRGSLSPTFAMAVMYVRNPRWDGVPFILKCGKGLNERKAEVRIQFRRFPGQLFEGEGGVNELVLRVQPNEAIYLKLITKSPGLSINTEQTELDLSYSTRFGVTSLPDAYERLLLDVLRGDQNLFVRKDELDSAWRIFTPVLHQIERERIRPELYPFGSRGPDSADRIAMALGVHRSPSYKWVDPSKTCATTVHPAPTGKEKQPTAPTATTTTTTSATTTTTTPAPAPNAMASAAAVQHGASTSTSSARL